MKRIVLTHVYGIINKCFDEIKGPYRLNNDGDSEPGDESAPNPYYPRYG